MLNLDETWSPLNQYINDNTQVHVQTFRSCIFIKISTKYLCMCVES